MTKVTSQCKPFREGLYTIQLKQFKSDEWLWRASVREFPSLTEFDESLTCAVSLLQESIAFAIHDLEKRGKTAPDPIQD